MLPDQLEVAKSYPICHFDLDPEWGIGLVGEVPRFHGAVRQKMQHVVQEQSEKICQIVPGGMDNSWNVDGEGQQWASCLPKTRDKHHVALA